MAAKKLSGFEAKNLAFTLAEVLIPKRMRGIINGVSNSRMSEIKEPSKKTKKLCAFTLAEVLITLAIIGVVAALTIPVVVAKYQKHQYYAQFMKMYNTLSNALTMATNDYGSYDTWGLSSYHDNSSGHEKKVADILKEYIKTAEAPTSFVGVSGLKVLGSTTELIGYSNMLSVFPNHFFLPDSSIIMVYYASPVQVTFYIDINGIKEPNTTGRDFFALEYKKSGGKYILTSPYEGLEHCNPNNPEDEEGGMSCAYRLLTEGKMNY